MGDDCYCDGTAHPFRRDYCGSLPTHDPATLIERLRARAGAVKDGDFDGRVRRRHAATLLDVVVP